MSQPKATKDQSSISDPTKQKTMKAAYINEFGDSKHIKVGPLPTPTPADNEVVINVAYAGANPVDWKIREGMMQKFMPTEFPLILGWDAAGYIASLGKGVKNFKVGDEVYVYARKPIVKNGTFAEFLTFDAQHVEHKPKNLSFAQASGVPLAALTAWQSLHEAAHLKKGETVLILNGSGGVGSFALQFAKLIGAKVLTTTGPKNQDYVKKLGAHHAFDYHNADLMKQIKSVVPDGVDVLYDCIGDGAGKQFADVIKKNGRLISIVEKTDKSVLEPRNIHFEYVFVRPHGEQLKHIAQLFEKNELVSPEITEFNLEDTGKGLDKLKENHVRGKIVFKIK
jgi:NADPH2:quinone reductase